MPPSLGKGTVPTVFCALRKFTRFGRMEDLGGFYSPNELGFEWLIAKDGSSDWVGVWGMSELKGGG